MVRSKNTRKDRLHHSREEHQKELEYSNSESEYTHKVKSTQEQVDDHTKSFGIIFE